MKVSGNYASGIDIPFRPDGDGGIALSEGDAYIRNLVLATVSINESDNPFQDLGSSLEPVFQNADDIEWRTAAVARVKRQFQTLADDNLARLVSVQFSQPDGEGNLELAISYINLESTTKSEVTVAIPRAGAQGTRTQASPTGGL